MGTIVLEKQISAEIIAQSGVQFGTSGARGLVEQFTADVCGAFTAAFINGMQKNFDFKQVAIGIDNRPSSYAMAQACAQALLNMGIDPIYCGVLPTPALAYSAMQDSIPCIMVTGSHIPFDRNGLKFYRPDGEITKADEAAIVHAQVPFDVITELPELLASNEYSERYVERYTSLFDSTMLQGKRIGIYEHSSAGRDLYPSIFEALGAEVISLERTDEFVPIDTEAVSDVDKQKARVWSKQYGLDFIFSTDGDGDRPLVADENGEWLRGDILGLLCSKALGIEALAVPVSCNTIIAQDKEFKQVSLTKIGSPYVIAEFTKLGIEYSSFSGFEANGGYLLGSDVEVNSKTLKALPTRDAVLPALMLLTAASLGSIHALVEQLPQRFCHSDRIQNFATIKSLNIIEKANADIQWLLNEVGLNGKQLAQIDQTDGLRLTLSDSTIVHLRPSGNAPELRCYAEAETAKSAHQLVHNTLTVLQALSI